MFCENRTLQALKCSGSDKKKKKKEELPVGQHEIFASLTISAQVSVLVFYLLVTDLEDKIFGSLYACSSLLCILDAESIDRQFRKWQK